jgi:hypothetical protein
VKEPSQPALGLVHSPVPSPEDEVTLGSISRHPPMSNNISMTARHSLTTLFCTTNDPRPATFELRTILPTYLNATYANKQRVAHKLLYQFMEHYCYIVPCDDLDDLREQCHGITGCNPDLLFMEAGCPPPPRLLTTTLSACCRLFSGKVVAGSAMGHDVRAAVPSSVKDQIAASQTRPYPNSG